MDSITRYMLANARLRALADVKTWSQQDLFDVFHLCNPAMPHDVWAERIGVASTVQEDESSDEVTSNTIAMILDGKAQRLVDDGIIEIKEVPA